MAICTDVVASSKSKTMRCPSESLFNVLVIVYTKLYSSTHLLIDRNQAFAQANYGVYYVSMLLIFGTYYYHNCYI